MKDGSLLKDSDYRPRFLGSYDNTVISVESNYDPKDKEEIDNTLLDITLGHRLNLN